jgi:alpha/beta superfamily hydrolase
MVGRGEVLERMTTIDGPAGVLEALWQGGGIGAEHGAPVLVVPPHPRLGGSMDSAVLAELVWSLGRRRHPTLRFNFRGVGASQGTLALPWLPVDATSASDADEAHVAVDVSDLCEDAAAALAQLLQSTGERTAVVVGVSVGAIVAAHLLAHHDGVERGLLVAPPLAAARFVVDDEAAFDVDALSRSGCPVSVVVGSHDRFVDVEALQRACAPLGHVHVIDGADHLFQRGLVPLARHAVQVLSGGDDEVM